jgi:HSP20 family protein
MADQQSTAVEVQNGQPATIWDQIEREFADMRQRMADAFRRPFAPLYGPPMPRAIAWAPRADAYEKDGTLIVKAELPGVKRDDITVTVHDRVLTVEGKRTEEKDVTEGRYYTAERFSGAFARSFALPEGVDPNTITAQCMDGVLEVRVPLPAQAKAEAVTIPIKS